MCFVNISLKSYGLQFHHTSFFIHDNFANSYSIVPGAVACSELVQYVATNFIEVHMLDDFNFHLYFAFY